MGGCGGRGKSECVCVTCHCICEMRKMNKFEFVPAAYPNLCNCF